MLDQTEFSITVEERHLEKLDDVLLLFRKLHGPEYNFYFKASTADKITLDTCHKAYKEKEHFPLEVILPMIRYKAQQLKEIPDPFYDGDGSSIEAFLVSLDYHGLHITRKYLYAGK